MYTSDEIRTALLSLGSFNRYWWERHGTTTIVRMPDLIEGGHRIPRHTTVRVVEVYGDVVYDSYGYISEGGYSAGIVFEVDAEFWLAEGHGDSYRVMFGNWSSPDDETSGVFRKVTKKTRTVSEYV